jgi:hypothetical protein
MPVLTLAAIFGPEPGPRIDALFFIAGLVYVGISYCAILLVGLPLFLLLRDFKWLQLLAACTTGIAIPYAMFHSSPGVSAAVAVGFSVSITAYLLRPTTPKTKLLQNDNEAR